MNKHTKTRCKVFYKVIIIIITTLIVIIITIIVIIIMHGKEIGNV